MVKVLVFDTETTGLSTLNINEKESLDREPNLWQKYIENWPYIVQLGYIMFDTDTKETIVNDVYVNLPSKFTNETYLTNPTTHEITVAAIRTGLNSDRINISVALTKFMTFFREADVVTGHNVDFDINMLLAECIRTENPFYVSKASTETDAAEDTMFAEIINVKNSKKNKIYCTGCKSKNLLKIYYEYNKNKNKNKNIYKMPKLKQAYFRMFGYAPLETSLHNALIDVVVCLRVFYRLWFKGIKFEQNPSPTDKTELCGVGEPDIYAFLSRTPENPIIKIINECTPNGIDPSGVGSPGLTVCPPIDNDKLESIMTGKTIEEIKSENKKKYRQKNRSGIYDKKIKETTVIIPQKGGSIKSKKIKKSKRSKNTKRLRKSKK